MKKRGRIFPASLFLLAITNCWSVLIRAACTFCRIRIACGDATQTAFTHQRTIIEISLVGIDEFIELVITVLEVAIKMLLVSFGLGAYIEKHPFQVCEIAAAVRVRCSNAVVEW